VRFLPIIFAAPREIPREREKRSAIASFSSLSSGQKLEPITAAVFSATWHILRGLIGSIRRISPKSHQVLY
jgi:hypothetical protein